MKKKDLYNSIPLRSKKESSLWVLPDLIMLILSIFFAILLLSAYLARYIDPETVWFFAFAGLVAPILYILNILTLLYWALRWKIKIIIPAAAIIMGISNITLFFRPAFSKNYSDPDSKSTIVMSHNVMGFIAEDEKGKYYSCLDSMISFIRSHDPDIVCLQEFQSRSAKEKEIIDTMIALPFNVVNYKLKNSSGGGWGVAIYSNYPIISSGSIDYPNSSNSTVWADIIIRTDTVRVFNNHLQTTSVNFSEREYISSQEFMQNTPDREERVKGIATKLKRNFVIRAEQVDTLAPFIHESPYRLMVCGDFNDTPMSYTYFKIRGNLADSFVEKGRGISSNTFNGLFNMFRIDYILHSKDIKALSYKTFSNEYSDHKAVVSAFMMPGSQ